jgi:hypothetical protein
LCQESATHGRPLSTCPVDRSPHRDVMADDADHRGHKPIEFDV